MATSRGAFRYPVDLHGWVHAEGCAPSEARVVDLSRTGAGLWLARGGPLGPSGPFDPDGYPEVGRAVRLAVADVVAGRVVARQWCGRVTHDLAAPDGFRRVGLAFEGPAPAAGTDDPWPLSFLPVGPAAPADVSAAEVAVRVPGLDRLAAAVALAGLTADQASKAWAWSDALADPVHLVPDLLAVVPSANPGALGSLAEGIPATARLCALGALILAALAPGWAAPPPGRDARRLGPALGGGLLMAGLVGNATDRLVLGYVRDFLVSGAFPEWAFNLADVFLIAGALTLLAARFGRPPAPANA